jgi:Gly-Xaa carboxypeptidase
MDEKNRQAALPAGPALTTHYYTKDASYQPRYGRTRAAINVVKPVIACIILFICFYVNIWTFITGPTLESIESTPHGDDDGPVSSVMATQCPAQYAVAPHGNPDITERNIGKLFPSAEFRNLSVKRLSGAVQIPTVSYDDNGPIGEDPRWDVFFDLERYFREAFPLL